MNKMKKILAFSIFALLVVFTANAQVPTAGYQTVWRGTNYANTGTNIAPAVSIDCSKSQVVTVQWSVACTAATGTNAIALAPSVDNKNFLPYSLYILNGLAAGTNTAGTNITVAGFQFLKFGYMTNWFSAGDSTNCYVVVGTKVSAP